jgi:hypothetical protein
MWANTAWRKQGLTWLNGWLAAYLAAVARAVAGLPHAQLASGRALVLTTLPAAALLDPFPTQNGRVRHESDTGIYSAPRRRNVAIAEGDGSADTIGGLSCHAAEPVEPHAAAGVAAAPAGVVAF